MTGGLFGLVLLAVAAQSSAVLPLGYHERSASGWTLLAVSVPIPDHTACIMDRPPGDDLPADGDILETLVAGHPVERIDGAASVTLIRRLLTHRAPEGARDAAIAPIDRHVLALAGARWRELGADSTAEGPGPPVLLLAGPESPDELMRTLAELASELPEAPRTTQATEGATDPPSTGWWRHVEGDASPKVAIGLGVPSAGPELSFSARIALEAFGQRLAAFRGGATRRELRMRGGSVHVFEWSMPADSTPFVHDAALEALAELRRSSMGVTAFERERAKVVAADRAAIHSPPNRWFASALAAELGGEPPRSAHDAGRVWSHVTQESVREAARTLLPHGVTVVSFGELGDMAEQSPTERWPVADVVYVDALAPGARDRLAEHAVRRAQRRLWADAAPQAVTVESEWVLSRADGPLSGRLVETLLFPDAIRRDYYPAGPDLVFSTWLVADSLRAAIQGAPRDTLPGERGRLRDRREADAWSAVRLASEMGREIRYEGPAHADGEVFQSLTVPLGDHALRLWLSPETGLPERVFIERGATRVTPEYRFAAYVDGDGFSYPGRIERHVGARREAVLTVRACAPATRLAAVERLQ